MSHLQPSDGRAAQCGGKRPIPPFNSAASRSAGKDSPFSSSSGLDLRSQKGNLDGQLGVRPCGSRIMTPAIMRPSAPSSSARSMPVYGDGKVTTSGLGRFASDPNCVDNSTENVFSAATEASVPTTDPPGLPLGKGSAVGAAMRPTSSAVEQHAAKAGGGGTAGCGGFGWGRFARESEDPPFSEGAFEHVDLEAGETPDDVASVGAAGTSATGGFAKLGISETSRSLRGRASSSSSDAADTVATRGATRHVQDSDQGRTVRAKKGVAAAESPGRTPPNTCHVAARRSGAAEAVGALRSASGNISMIRRPLRVGDVGRRSRPGVEGFEETGVVGEDGEQGLCSEDGAGRFASDRRDSEAETQQRDRGFDLPLRPASRPVTAKKRPASTVASSGDLCAPADHTQQQPQQQQLLEDNGRAEDNRGGDGGSHGPDPETDGEDDLAKIAQRQDWLKRKDVAIAKFREGCEAEMKRIKTVMEEHVGELEAMLDEELIHALDGSIAERVEDNSREKTRVRKVECLMSAFFSDPRVPKVQRVAWNGDPRLDTPSNTTARSCRLDKASCGRSTSAES